MVKIYENSPQLQEKVSQHDMTTGAQTEQEDNSVKSAAKQLNGKLEGGGKSSLPPPDLRLVAGLRKLLKEEYDKDPEEFERTYSMPHYHSLMDPNSLNTCWRYLLQRDQVVEGAFELCKQTLAWRQANRVDQLKTSELVKDFWLLAPMGFTGKTKSGNDLIYAIGKNFKKPDPKVRQTIRDFITFIIFDWDNKHQDDLEQLELVFDVSDTGIRNIDLDFSSWLVSIRDYLPARIKAIYFVGMPFIIRPIIRLIISWLPERFRKISLCGSYNDLVRANIDDDCIPEEIGGKADNKWRLAPLDSPWAHEIESADTNEIYEKICQACCFNYTQEHLDKLYKMQREYEKAVKHAAAQK